MISLKATKFSMRHVNLILRPRAAGPADRSAGGTAGGGQVDSDAPPAPCDPCHAGQTRPLVAAEGPRLKAQEPRLRQSFSQTRPAAALVSPPRPASSCPAPQS